MEQGSEPLENQRHEDFAVHYSQFNNASKAWLVAGGDNPVTANRQGDKWARKGDIVARVAWLKAEAAKENKKRVDKINAIPVLEIAEKREILAGIARGGEKDADRINAIKADTDLAGDGAAGQIEIVIRIGK